MSIYTLLCRGLSCLSFLTTPVLAGPDKAPVLPPPAPEPRTDLWEVSVFGYGWLAGLDGTSGVHGFTADVDVDFEQILENLDMVAMFQFEARRGPWSFMLDGQYLKLSADTETPGRLLSTAGLEFEQIMAETTVGYRVVQSERGWLDVFAGARYMRMEVDLSLNLDESGVRSLSEDISSEIVDRVVRAGRAVAAEANALVRDRIDGITGGARPGNIVAGSGPVRDAIRELIAAKAAIPVGRRPRPSESVELAAAGTADAALSAATARVRQRLARAEKRLARAIEKAIREKLPAAASGSEDWVDPIVGVRGLWNFSRRFYCLGRADIGGFGVGSDFAWQVYGALGWRLSERTSLELGYRHLDVDYASGGFVFDAATGGAVVGLKVVF